MSSARHKLSFALASRTSTFLPCLKSSSSTYHICSRPRFRASLCPPLVIGLNQYSHDASIAVLNAQTGAILFALSKERLSRRKHDGGDVAHLVKHALLTLCEMHSFEMSNLLSMVRLVVANNHHFRIAAYERRVRFLTSLKYAEETVTSEWNLIGTTNGVSNGTKIEISHHLAHAFSAVWESNMERGLIVIMDGMGDNLNDWQNGLHDDHYYCEEKIGVCENTDHFREFPEDVKTRKGVSFREAETAYVFRKTGKHVEIRRVFKRWTPEVEPSELPNHSFEEMESVGAMYSRVSAILFKDWNACGKVMGLAPYGDERLLPKRKPGDRYFIKGDIYDGTLSVKHGKRMGLDQLHCKWDNSHKSPKLRQYFEDLAFYIQADLEDVATNFVSKLLQLTGEQNLIFAGGVALNSSLNGLLSEQNDVANLYIPPFPGDEGIAIGCAAFGCSHATRDGLRKSLTNPTEVSMPYYGRAYSQQDIKHAVDSFRPWVTVKETNTVEATARALASSKIVAWFQGRSEFGPRALGNRSILADPRSPNVLNFVNAVVKKREAFRPLAPSVLSEDVDKWFGFCAGDSSPFMSMTKRSTMQDMIPAVVHVDGSSRLQTVDKAHNSNYHGVIAYFKKLTGIPIVLNTSFNVAGQPIVETPYDALQTFLDADGIDLLVFPGLVVERKDWSQISATLVVSSSCSSFRSLQYQDESGACLRTKLAYIPACENFETDVVQDDYEHSVELMDGLQLELLETIHNVGPCQISKLVNEFALETAEGSDEEMKIEEYATAPTPSHILDRIRDLIQKRLVKSK